MDVSIGVMAYNEESNIGRVIDCLNYQKTKEVCIKEIIVVSSGSNDRTDEICRTKDVTLFTENSRKGKASAINLFLQRASSEVVVLCSADILPESDCIEKLCQPMNDESIGIVACRPIPTNKGTMGKIIRLMWDIHHKISLIEPKYGELIAFRNTIDLLPNTCVDEEYIAREIKKNFRGAYQQDAIVRNHGPENIRDFLIQRRRIYCGHRKLAYEGYEVPTMNTLRLIKEGMKNIRIDNFHILAYAGILELMSRIAGSYDYISKKDHTAWEIARTTKSVY